jgi:hypothetical protein
VFAERVTAGTIERHMGFPESIAALAERLDLQVDRITDRLEATLAERPLQLTHRLIGLGKWSALPESNCTCCGRASIKMDQSLSVSIESVNERTR